MEHGVHHPDIPRRAWWPHPAWLLLGAIVLGLLGVGCACFYPYYRTQILIGEIGQLGGTVESGTAHPAWVREYVAPEFLPSMPSLVFADLRSIATDDELAARLGRERGLRILIVSGPELTDRGLIALWEAPQLERVVLIDCPRISTPVLKKLRSAQPSRLINLRGPALLGINGIDVADGCRLLHVEAASAAELAGLLPGDVITTFNGRPVTGFEPLSDLIAEHKPGETVTLSFLRGSESQQVRPVLQAWKAAGRSRLRRK